MKKLVFSMMLAGLVASACTKELPVVGPSSDKHEVVFNASNLKTVLDGDDVNWVKDDQISILWGTGAEDVTTSSASKSGKTTTFTATVGTADNYYAVHPSTIVASLIDSDSLSVNIPKTQRGTFDKANITVAQTTKDAMELHFLNLCAIMKVTITRSDVAEVSFTGTNKETVVGDGVRVLLGDDFPEISYIQTPRNTTILKPEEGSVFTPGVYYWAILPGDFYKGFKFTCKNASGIQVASKSYTKSFTFNRSDVVDMGPVDNVSSLLFVTVAGGGTKDGSSWTNAMGVSELRTMLTSADAAVLSKLNGSEIRLAGGDYLIATSTDKCLSVSYSETMPVSFKGGYDSTTGERDLANQTTAFSGNKDRSIFSFGANVAFGFDGITFKDASLTTDGTSYRGAMFVNASSAVVSIDNCKFIDNVQSGFSATTNEGGAAIYQKSGKVYVKNTLFKGNSSGSRGGAIRSEADKAVLFLSKCQFIGNKITRDAYGTSMFVKCNLGMSGCTFNGGSAPSAKNNPAINVNNNYILVDNTVVEKANLSTGTGAIRTETTGSYCGLFINNIIVNDYSGTDTAWGMLCSKTDKKAISKGYNIFSGKDNGISHTARFDVLSSDITATDYTTLGPSGYSLDPVTNEIVWNGSWTSYTKADAATVKAAVTGYTTSAGVTTLGTDFANWLGL